MARRVTIPIVSASLLVLSTGCGTHHYLLGQTVRPGMPFDRVYRRVGKPDVGFGLPRKGPKRKSRLFYEIPFNKYLVINFVGYVVDDPPASVESRRVLIR